MPQMQAVIRPFSKRRVRNSYLLFAMPIEDVTQAAGQKLRRMSMDPITFSKIQPGRLLKDFASKRDAELRSFQKCSTYCVDAALSESRAAAKGKFA